LRHDLVGVPVSPIFRPETPWSYGFRINSHRNRFLQTSESFLGTPWFIAVKNGIDKDSEFSCDGAAGGFFGFTPFTQMVVKISDDWIIKTSGSGSDEESHFESLIALDGHFEVGFDFAGFPDDGVEAHIADELFRSFESFNIADFGNDGGDGYRTDAGDGVKAMVGERRIKSRDNIFVESFNLGKQLDESLGCPRDNEGSSVGQGFDGSVLGKFDKPGGEFRPNFMSESDREIGEFGLTHGDEFIGGRNGRKSDEHFHGDFFTEKLFVSGEMDAEKSSEPIFEFGGIFLKRPSDAGKFLKFLLPGQIRKRRFGGHLSEVESNHVSVEFIGFINLQMHFLKLLNGIRIDDVDMDFSRAGGKENVSEVFVKVGSGFHSGDDFGSFPDKRSGGDDCAFEAADAVRGICENSVGPDGLSVNISESDVKLCFGDVDTDKKFFHGKPPEKTKTQTSGRMRQRGSSENPARLSLPNCAVVPQDIIKAQSRGMRRYPPLRGRATCEMKACSSSPRYKIYQNKKIKVGRSNLDTWISNA
jgi:hypothetical protein